MSNDLAFYGLHEHIEVIENIATIIATIFDMINSTKRTDVSWIDLEIAQRAERKKIVDLTTLTVLPSPTDAQNLIYDVGLSGWDILGPKSERTNYDYKQADDSHAAQNQYC